MDVRGPTPQPAVRVSPDPSGSSTALTVSSEAWSPNGRRLAFRADLETWGVEELYLVDTGSSPLTSVKVTPSFLTGRTVTTLTPSFAWLPDATGLIYHAEQEVDGLIELYLARLATPGVSTKLSPALSATSDVDAFVISEDEAWIAFVADPVTASEDNLFFATLAPPGPPLQVNRACQRLLNPVGVDARGELRERVGLHAAESKGAFFSCKIRNHYSYNRLS